MYLSTGEASVIQGEVRFEGISNPNNETSFVDLSADPAVEKHSQFYKFDNSEVSLDEHKYGADVLVADTLFLQITDFPILSGTKNFTRPEDVFITEAFAKKIFGKENPVGKTLDYPAINKQMTIAGVIGKPVNKSIISFDLLLSSQITHSWAKMPQSLILLHPNVDYRAINSKYSEFMDMSRWKYSIRYQLIPYKKVYFEDRIVDYVGYAHSKFIYVVILSGVGFLLLLIGTLNYINIYTIVALRRSKEFGMKKVFGAEGYKVFLQLVLENLSVIVLSLGIAFWLAGALNTFVTNAFGFEQFPNLRFDILLALVLTLALPAVTSITPLLRYRYLTPIKSLKSVSGGNKSLLSRQMFLAFQFFITMTLIAVSLLFVRQLDYMLGADLGYRTHNIIEVPFFKANEDVSFAVTTSRGERKNKEKRKEQIVDELTQKLNASPLVHRWIRGDRPILKSSSGFDFKTPDGEFKSCTLIGADENWLNFFEVQLLEGRSWDNDTDNTFTYNLIVGESTLKQFGITDYREATLEPARRLWYVSGRDEEMKTNPPYRIVGVINDLYVTHLSQKQPPLAMYFGRGGGDDPVFISFAPENKAAVLEFVKNLHEELIGGEFSYSFIEDELKAIYREDEKIARIYSVFTVIAIFISILGLFGISLFDIRQRRKEIAIRKINGASTKDIMLMLVKKYLALLGVSFALSVPVAWYAIDRYLENFAFRTQVSWWLFAVALALTAAVSLITLIYQVYTASNKNPTETVNSEQ
jgi:ABC-type antimicrobial peptide transport system permease subunit